MDKDNDNDYSTQLDRLAKVFNDKTKPPLILPTKPDEPTSIVSLPPSKLDVYNQPQPDQVVLERAEQLADALNGKHRGRGRPKGSKNKKTLAKERREKELTEHLRSVYGAKSQSATSTPSTPSTPSTSAFDTLTTPTITKRMDVDNDADTTDFVVGTSIGIGIGSDSNGSSLVAEEEKHKNFDASAGVGASTREIEKLPHRGKGRRKRGEIRKLSQGVEYLGIDFTTSGGNRGRGASSLCYLDLYARTLSPLEINFLMNKKDELKLTASEVIALELIEKTLKGDKVASKTYWDIMKTQKNDKITPIKSEKSLLDDALEKSENAIFGEIVLDSSAPS